eukprot:3077392-Pyramimonas_sp.AAC.1
MEELGNEIGELHAPQWDIDNAMGDDHSETELAMTKPTNHTCNHRRREPLHQRRGDRRGLEKP